MFRILLISSALLLGACREDPSDNSVFLDGYVDREGDAVVARVGGTPIYLTDVQRLAVGQERVGEPAQFTPSSPDFADVREELINQRVAALTARDLQLNLTDEAARRLALAEERMLGNLLVERHLDQAVTEERLRELYDQQLALREPADEVRASHILVATQAEAEAARARVEAGEDFAEVAEDVSTDAATAPNGGDLDWFTRGAFVDAFSDAAFATAVGEMSPPVQTDFGWHVIFVADRREDEVPSFEALRDELEEFLVYDSLEAYVNDLRANADVEVIDSIDTSGMDTPEAPAVPTPEER